MEHVQTQVLPSPLLSTAPPPSFGCHFLPVPLKLVGALGPHRFLQCLLSMRQALASILPQGLLSMSIGAGFICSSRLSQETLHYPS